MMRPATRASNVVAEIFEHIVHEPLHRRHVTGSSIEAPGRDRWLFHCAKCARSWTLSRKMVEEEPELIDLGFTKGPQRLIEAMLQMPVAVPAQKNAWARVQDGFLDDD